MQTFQNQRGVTLVEIAIVVVVVGLLIGGVLKGNEMLTNSKAASTVSQIKELSGAFRFFKENYYYYPGDMLNPGGTLGNCTAAPCNRAGDGNGEIGSADHTLYQNSFLNSENDSAWAQLAAVGLVKGVKPNATVKMWGESHPAAPIGGGFIVIHRPNEHNLFITHDPLETTPLTAHYLLTLARPDSTPGDYEANFTLPSVVRFIDLKMDDGMPNTGRVLAGGRRLAGGNNCVESGANSAPYNFNSSRCNLLFRMDDF